jgi:hypothetical protein
MDLSSALRRGALFGASAMFGGHLTGAAIHWFFTVYPAATTVRVAGVATQGVIGLVLLLWAALGLIRESSHLQKLDAAAAAERSRHAGAAP